MVMVTGRIMTPETRLPTYARIALSLLALVLFVAVLHYGRSLLTPIAFAGFLAVLLYPVSQFIERRGIPRVLAILITVVLAGVVIFGVTTFIGYQVSQFTDELPRLKERGAQYVGDVQGFVRERFGISYRNQTAWFRERMAGVFQGGAILGTVGLFTGILGIVILVPLYLFLLLLYKDLLMEFFFRVFARSQSGKIREVMDETKLVLQSYLIGLMIEVAIVAVLNCAALMLLGVEYAILFGVMAAVLNLIPYIGIFIGGVLPTVMALITKDSPWYAVGVIGAFTLIQVLDNNLIVPKVVASRVSINALVSVVAVVGGGFLWGLSGMFLSIPAVAIAKVILDRTESLQPWGMLLGGEIAGPRRGDSK